MAQHRFFDSKESASIEAVLRSVEKLSATVENMLKHRSSDSIKQADNTLSTLIKAIKTAMEPPVKDTSSQAEATNTETPKRSIS